MITPTVPNCSGCFHSNTSEIQYPYTSTFPAVLQKLFLLTLILPAFCFTIDQSISVLFSVCSQQVDINPPPLKKKTKQQQQQQQKSKQQNKQINSNNNKETLQKTTTNNKYTQINTNKQTKKTPLYINKICKLIFLYWKSII